MHPHLLPSLDLRGAGWSSDLVAVPSSRWITCAVHRIAFGNGAAGLPLETLFFAAGSAGGRHGALGPTDAAR
jgi:hypothetical protein